jgi:dienelactone hydrolase
MATSLLMLLPLITHGADVLPSDVGDYFGFLNRYAEKHSGTLSYLSGNWPDRETWQKQGRAKMSELLNYHPDPAPAPDAEVLETVQKKGYTRYLVRYSITADRKTEAFLLVPDGLTKPAPAVVALHCHSGFYYYGKEKITEIENPPQVLQDLINKTYGGRCFADELARHGFVVLVPDAFYFGVQRLPVDSLPERYTEDLKKLKPGSDEYIREFNSVSSDHESTMAKTIFESGTTWPGILVQGDIASVDYLVTRPEVDASRIGCMGLSIGGWRAAYLFGLDPRLKAGVVAGWMTPYTSLIHNHCKNHTWMLHVPGQVNWLDLTDMTALNGPNPLMVIDCLQDSLFPLDGMRAAEARLAEIYKRMGAPDHFLCKYYDLPHSLKVPAQDDAIAWLEKGLK